MAILMRDLKAGDYYEFVFREGFFVAQVAAGPLGTVEVKYLRYGYLLQVWDNPYQFTRSPNDPFLGGSAYIKTIKIPNEPALKTLLQSKGIPWPLTKSQIVGDIAKEMGPTVKILTVERRDPLNLTGCECGQWKTGGKHSSWCKCYKE